MAKSWIGSLFDYASREPALAAGVGTGLFWGAIPAEKHNGNGHDHQKYCNGLKGWRKWAALGVSMALPYAADLGIRYVTGGKEDLTTAAMKLASDMAFSDSDPSHEEKERRAYEGLRKDEAKIRRHLYLDMWYDALDAQVRDPLLLPKYDFDKIPFIGGLKATEKFKGQRIDVVGLSLGVIRTIDINGSVFSLLDAERATALIGENTLEAIYSPIPTITLGLGYEMMRKARRYAEPKA